MQTSFAPERLADSQIASSEKILRTCVHCGFCTATCPTYVLGGDELDSPRGRIYLIKDMLENDKPASKAVVTHVDRCLSCLSCMTTCPSGVHYMHLVDHARAHIEKTYRRPLADRMVRRLLGLVLPYPARFRAALVAGKLAQPFRGLLRALPGGMRLDAMLGLVPARLPKAIRTSAPAMATPPSARIVMLGGCAQTVLKPAINAATDRLLARLGVEVVAAPGEGCCGALVHHMGDEAGSHRFARANIDAWTRVIEADGLDAIIITASGCGTTIKDYGFMFRNDPAYAEKAARVSALAMDITEFLATRAIAPTIATGQVVAYHSACSMQHGQQIKDQPKTLLKAAGFVVKDVPEGHICCGSAGTYNILQPEIAGQLRARKVANIERVRPEIIATGNIGCMTQIGLATGIPIVHTIELLDWATGGPMPAELEGRIGSDGKDATAPVAAQ
ncbi:glycolate oxidase iron-sulfur subunit [Arsenicitalea aurantiaca]|uniref:Glycolate oxidase iron-sulfur subunit n=1 Tax=Arsenicitalea aurantiaca TaxID=1783274 RepID=A0A433X450_9HYPH|nr:glycolate oxidase subunit GlcF [Arsenicitalea aurantiaca]RUT28843.1 glycolate oxidase iron-sulfur subunit [Arsenicitalea aurantiaca]